MSKAKRRTPRGQGELLDVHHPQEKKLLALASTYRELRDVRMAATKPEVAAREELVTAMQQSKLESFERDGYIVRLKYGTTKVSVKLASEKDDGDE